MKATEQKVLESLKVVEQLIKANERVNVGHALKQLKCPYAYEVFKLMKVKGLIEPHGDKYHRTHTWVGGSPSIYTAKHMMNAIRKEVRERRQRKMLKDNRPPSAALTEKLSAEEIMNTIKPNPVVNTLKKKNPPLAKSNRQITAFEGKIGWFTCKIEAVYND